jgi:hypothetical protein
MRPIAQSFTITEPNGDKFMKRNRASKSGFITPRNSAALLLCTFGILLTGLAATQSDQTMRLQTSTVATTLTPSAAPAATGPSPGGGTLSVSNRTLSYTWQSGVLRSHLQNGQLGRRSSDFTKLFYILRIRRSLGKRGIFLP